MICPPGFRLERPHCRLTTEWLKVAPFLEEPGVEISKDILDLPARAAYNVNTSYRNLLFIYPRSVNLSSRQGTARNICVRAELMDAKETPQEVFYGKTTGTRLTGLAQTAVLYHNKFFQASVHTLQVALLLGRAEDESAG